MDSAGIPYQGATGGAIGFRVLPVQHLGVEEESEEDQPPELISVKACSSRDALPLPQQTPPSLHPVGRRSPQSALCQQGDTSCLRLWGWIISMMPYAFLTGPWYLNWTPFNDLLVKEGVYAWLCSSPGALETPIGGVGGEGLHDGGSREGFVRGRCLAQEEALSNLFTVVSMTTFCCSVFSGLLLDHVGARMCAVTGWSLMIGGWLLVCCSSSRFNGYGVGLGLLGASIDAAFFPLIAEARHSGPKSGFAVATLGACRSGAFSVPLALRALNSRAGLSLSALSIFVGVIPCLLCVVVALLCLPPGIPLYTLIKARKTRRGPPLSTQAALADGLSGGVVVNPCFSSASRQKATEAVEEKSALPISEDSGEERSRVSLEAQRKTRQLQQLIENLHEQQDERLQEVVQTQSPPASGSYQGSQHAFLVDIVSELRSPHFLFLVPVAFTNVLSASFYLPSGSYLLPDAYDMSQVAHILPCVFAPIWGYAADVVGVVPTMAVCNLVALTAHALLLPLPAAPLAQQEASAVLSAARLGFLATQVYCYCNVVFSARNLGTLIGITWTIAGLGPLVAGTMRQRSLETGDFRSMLSITVGLAGINVILIAALFFLLRKRPVTACRQREDERPHIHSHNARAQKKAPIFVAIDRCSKWWHARGTSTQGLSTAESMLP
ncbi:major facilitator family protein [Cyclospora cayetanensis]|uniref:Major facilitator family protein n=1 Tax=Cyclospora cayetanensis TaxID=88456 RepID=A0A1D3CWZ4_9EIME|nr:major facilitator family protein [Cyclospora cayetanensis]